MATQPTNLPVPSESPRDLKFNAGKIDEFVTSMGWTYTDRFGQKHYTIEGINYLSQQAMAAYGYVILTGKTFTTGATINNPNEVLLNTADGEYYKWTGSFASGGKVVPENSTPASTGGIGPGVWIGVGDASLRAALAAPGGVNLVNGAAKQTDLNALADRVDDVEESIFYSGKTAATHGKDMVAGVIKNIKFFGDSTMYGSEPPSLTQSVNNPPKMCKEALVALFGTSATPITSNYALPGTTLYDMIRGTDNPDGKTYEQRLTESPCDIVYCNHGINDNQTGKDILQYRKDLITFVKQSRQNNATPVLVTPNPQLNVLTGTPTNGKRFRYFVETIRSVAKDMAVDLVDNFYYMSRSFNVYQPLVVIPDGVHLSAAAYRQYGYNLAIPLVNAHTLRSSGDTAGINSSSFYTNSTNSRIEDHAARCGETFIWEKESTQTGINHAVILDQGFKYLGVNELYWPSSGIHNYFINATSVLANYEPRKTTGSTSFLDWDGITKISGNIFAGLCVVGVLVSSGASVGTGATYSGLTVLGPSFTSVTDMGGNYPPSDYVLNGDTIAIVQSWATGTEVSLKDLSSTLPNNKVIVVTLSGSTLRAAYWANGVELSGVNMSTSVTAGTYYTSFGITSKSVIVTVGTLQTTLSLTVDLSKLKLDTKGQSFTVIRS
ncbi:GDSL-type esterase/lipase family protein [Enterobacteriaceae bacterium 155047]|uniref:tail fiber/spike domain-containing protein n=1 Tax=Huaxiibacter chinensis TaxID=2899785 RepID=UPI002164417F|nr:GDSL-type esterase/lipase family protein [Huaxiibacter chinensis]MCG5044342.1 GDSL-type esterase/lipase family protein [Huaxiibacter chinensis]